MCYQVCELKSNYDDMLDPFGWKNVPDRRTEKISGRRAKAMETVQQEKKILGRRICGRSSQNDRPSSIRPLLQHLQSRYQLPHSPSPVLPNPHEPLRTLPPPYPRQHTSERMRAWST